MKIFICCCGREYSQKNKVCFGKKHTLGKARCNSKYVPDFAGCLPYVYLEVSLPHLLYLPVRRWFKWLTKGCRRWTLYQMLWQKKAQCELQSCTTAGWTVMYAHIKSRICDTALKCLAGLRRRWSFQRGCRPEEKVTPMLKKILAPGLRKLHKRR